jgi:hypothetical protein
MDSPKITLPGPELDRLEDEILTLCGHINAAEYRFLELLAEYDRADGWSRHGVASCVQWLNWQCGIGAVAARERVRTARALERLPLISEAFSRGELSYSKVRAMTRVATPENESTLLTIALHGTATHVEKLVRKYRWVRRQYEAERVESQYKERYLDTFWDDGALVIRARLPGEVGAMVKQAIEAAIAVADRTAAPDKGAVEGLNENQTQSNVSAEACASAQGVDETGRSRVVMEEIDVTEEVDHPIGARRADALALMARQFLAAESVSCGSAGDRYQVVVHIDQALLAEAPEVGSHSTPTEIRPHCCEHEDGRSLAIDTARRLACDGALVGIVEDEHGEPLSVGRKTRAIPPAIRRALKARDRGCRFPGCTHTRFTEGHHIEHWANGGETRLGNLITLCSFHHRLVHEGGFGLRVTDDGLFVFSKPDGTRLAEAGRLDRHLDRLDRLDPFQQPERCFGGSVAPTEIAALPLVALNRKHDLAIDERTAKSRWIGDPMDYGLTTEILCSNDHLP